MCGIPERREAPHSPAVLQAEEEPVVLINGLAERTESWFANRRAWSRNLDLRVPGILACAGESLHSHIESGGSVDVEYLTDRLAMFLDEFAQRPRTILSVLVSGAGRCKLRRQIPGESGPARSFLSVWFLRRQAPPDNGGGPAQQPRRACRLGSFIRPAL